MSAHDGGDCTVFKSRINLKIFFYYSHVLHIVISISFESVHLESDPINIIKKNDLEKKEEQVSVAIDFKVGNTVQKKNRSKLKKTNSFQKKFKRLALT